MGGYYALGQWVIFFQKYIIYRHKKPHTIFIDTHFYNKLLSQKIAKCLYSFEGSELENKYFKYGRLLFNDIFLNSLALLHS